MNNPTIIRVFSHGLSVKPADGRVKQVLMQFALKTAQWEFRKAPPSWKVQKKIVRVFAGATKSRNDFRFHRNQLDELIRHLDANGIGKSKLVIKNMDLPNAQSISYGFKMPPPRDYQVKLIEHLGRTDLRTKVTNLQAGRGKTLCGLTAINAMGKRALLQLRGGYVERWLTDIKAFMVPTKNELMIIRGSGPLKSVINSAKMGELSEDVKLIILTTGTLHSFLKEYEANGKDNAFGIEPQELYELLKIGVVLIDETHEGYHLNYRSDIYRNVESVIHLSATLDTEDRFRRMIYDILYPSEAWAPEVEYDAYIEVTAVKYHAYTPTRYPTTRRGSDMYSHAAFEEIFLKCEKTFTMYMTIILDRIMEQYIKTHKPGQKMLLFFSLTDMCDKAATWLKKKLTDLSICVFISGCSEELFLQNDIIVTTIESCGTARDIPDLVYAMLTRNVMRLEANEQIKGRLRKIKRWPEMAPKFDYLVCTSIPKHMEYHEAKINQFKGKVATHDEVISNYHLP